MFTLSKHGLRIAGTGSAAAVLALAAAVPAAAQTDYEYFRASFFETDSLVQLELLQHGDTSAHIAIEGPDPLQGDLIEVTMDFSANPGIVDLAPFYDRRCESNADVLTCVDDGTDDLSGTSFMLILNPGEQGAPGDVAEYTLTATVNGTAEEDRDGQITVSEDFLVDPELPEEPTDPDDGEAVLQRYAYLDHTVAGAAAGSTVTAEPQVLVTEDAADYRVGSLIVFTDAVDIDMWSDPDNYYDGYEMDTGTATVLDEYDNCDKWEVWLLCAVTDWNPETGAVYEPSAESPIRYEVETETAEGQLGVYHVSDLSAAGLEYYLEEFAIDLEGAKRFSLAEADEAAPAADFSAVEGWIEFSAAAAPDVPTAEEPGLPVTGDSSIVMISSAAAALLAGAVVFFMLRRRKAAQHWE